MRIRYLLISIPALFFSAISATSAFAAEAGGEAAHEGVSLKPQMLVDFGHGFGITNSMLVTWLVAAAIIVFAQIATRRLFRQETSGREYLGMAMLIAGVVLLLWG